MSGNASVGEGGYQGTRTAVDGKPTLGAILRAGIAGGGTMPASGACAGSRATQSTRATCVRQWRAEYPPRAAVSVRRPGSRRSATRRGVPPTRT